MHRCSRVLIPLTRGLHPKSLSVYPSSSVRTYYLRPRQAWHPLSILDETMKEMDREFRTLDSVFSLKHEIPHYLDEPSDTTLANRSEVVREGDKDIYTLNVRIGQDIPAENIKLSLKDRVLTVEAKSEQVSDDGKSRIYQEMSRQFTLPENVVLNEVKSSLTPEGILKIEAPLPTEVLEEAKPKEIPILKE